MDRYYAALVIAALAIMVSATPIPPAMPSWSRGLVAAVKVEEPKSVGIPPFEERMDMGLGGLLGWGWSSSKIPFEHISRPYESSIGRGFELPGGYGGVALEQWGGMGLPLLGNGPLGGAMGIPLMMLLG